MDHDEEPLWERLARTVGLNPTQLKWRLRRWRQQAEREARSVENRSRWLRYEHQSCPRCGQPQDREAAVCSSCGEKLAGRTLERAGRLMLEPLGKPLVLRLRFGGEVNLLVVRDHLTELAELVEDELGTAGITR